MKKDKLLELDVRAATYIILKVKQTIVKGKMDIINILINDKLSKLLYLANTNTNFKIQLPARLNQGLSKRWTLKWATLNMPRADMSMTSKFGFINVKVVDPLTSPSVEHFFKNNNSCKRI